MTDGIKFSNNAHEGSVDIIIALAEAMTEASSILLKELMKSPNDAPMIVVNFAPQLNELAEHVMEQAEKIAKDGLSVSIENLIKHLEADTKKQAKAKTPAKLNKAGPCLGEDTERVCTKILGISDLLFIELLADGVFE